MCGNLCANATICVHACMSGVRSKHMFLPPLQCAQECADKCIIIIISSSLPRSHLHRSDPVARGTILLFGSTHSGNRCTVCNPSCILYVQCPANTCAPAPFVKPHSSTTTTTISITRCCIFLRIGTHTQPTPMCTLNTFGWFAPHSGGANGTTVPPRNRTNTWGPEIARTV